MTDDFLAQCRRLATLNKPSPPDFVNRCLCVMGQQARCANGGTGEPSDTGGGGGGQAHLQTTQLTAADQLMVNAENITDTATADPPPDDDRPDDNLINSDVFIYVIVFIVIVYFLTFLYLCMKKRQREAEDAEAGNAGGGGGRGARSVDDRPPPYDEVVLGAHASGSGKCAEPPTYAEVLARSQQLDKLDERQEEQQLSPPTTAPPPPTPPPPPPPPLTLDS